MKTWRAWAMGTALLAVMSLVWPGMAQAQDKQVVVYTSNESTLNSLVFEAFEKDTGVKVQPVAAGSGVIVKRIVSEKERPLGDVIWGVSRSLLETNREHFTPYRSKNHEAIPGEYRDPENLWIGNNIHLMVILQNTKLLSAGEGPRSWQDLLDPKWKGKIAFTDPANSGSAYTTATLLVSLFGGGELGWEKVTRFFANTRVLNKSSLVFQGVGNGEYPLGVSLEYAGYLWASNGAPVKVIYPSDGTVGQMEGCAVIKGGPNPNAAKQFVDFINRKEVRELILSKTFRRPARQDLDLSRLPGGMPALASLKIAPYDEKGWTAARTPTMERIKDIIVKTR